MKGLGFYSGSWGQRRSREGYAPKEGRVRRGRLELSLGEVEVGLGRREVLQDPLYVLLGEW